MKTMILSLLIAVGSIFNIGTVQSSDLVVDTINEDIFYVGGDDYPNIQDAIDAIVLTPVGSGTVMVPPGYYTGFTVPKGDIRVVGAGPNATIIRKLSGAQNLIEIGIPGNHSGSNRRDRVSIENMGVDCKGFGGNGIIATHMHESLIKNVLVTNCDIGVNLEYSWSNRLEFIQSVNNDTANILIDTASNFIDMEFITVSDTDVTYGLHINAGSNVTVNGLLAEGNFGTYAVYVSGGSDNVHISQMHGESSSGTWDSFVRVGDGTNLSENISIKDGYIWSSTGVANNYIETDGEVANLVIENMKLRIDVPAWAKPFIEIGGASNITLTNNTLQGYPGGSNKGYDIKSDVDNIFLTNNKYQDVININNGVDFVNIQGGDIECDGDCGSSFNGESITIDAGNEIKVPGGTGYEMSIRRSTSNYGVQGLYTNGSIDLTTGQNGHAVRVNGLLMLNGTPSGSNPGTDICIGSNNVICACGSCI